jgi:hypothetical protein
MFCTGTTMLPDGRLLVNGGNQAWNTSIYNVATLAFTAAQKMTIPRGYNANTILQDGTVFTIGGSWQGGIGGKTGEVFTTATGWKALSGIPSAAMETKDTSNNWVFDSHYWLIPGGNGRVFHAGPGVAMHWLDPRGSGAFQPAGRRGDDTFAITGTVAMVDAGKLFKAGGSPVYANSPSSRNAYLIDISVRATVKKLSPMIFPRGYVNGVVLPDGKVMLVGGQTYMKEFSDANAVLPTEIYDPDKGFSTLTAPVAVPRNYHAVAILLPDARVLSAGGGLCGSCTANHPDLQVFSPPYLFDAAGNPAVRPKILTAPTTVEYGRSITVKTDRAIKSFAMIRLSAVTHTINNDQRRLSVGFTTTGTNTYALRMTDNPGWLLPGYWMLFAINDAGTPSVARILQVKLNRTVDIVSPFEARGRLNSYLSIGLKWKSLGPAVKFSAGGLPSGVTINATTGTISGTPKSRGVFRPVIRGQGPAQTIATDFVLQID